MTVVVQPNVATPDGRLGVQTGELLLVTEDGRSDCTASREDWCEPDEREHCGRRRHRRRPQQPDRGGLLRRGRPGGRRPRGAADRRRQHGDRGADPARLPARLMLERARPHPDQPGHPGRRARADQARPALRPHRSGRRPAAGRRRRDRPVPRPRATAAELARCNPADGEAYLRLLADWEGGLAGAHARWNAGRLDPAASPPTPRTRRCASRSAHEVIAERFSSEQARDLLTWLSFATITDVRRAGTGILPFSITAGRAFGWATPMGGSGALPDALVSSIESNGGRVHVGRPVERVRRPQRPRGRRRHRRRGGLGGPPGGAVLGAHHAAGRHARRRRGAGGAALGGGDLAAGAHTVRRPPRHRREPDLRHPHRSAGRGRRRDRLGGRACTPSSTPSPGGRRTRSTRGCSSSARPSSTPTGRRAGRAWRSC